MKIVALLTLLISWNLSAQVDYSARALLRSHPLAGSAEATIGYSQKFWQEKGTIPILYGFIRPSATFRTSGTINTVRGRISIYPISILGIFADTSYSIRKNDKLPTFDCDAVVCEDSAIKRKTFGFRFALAYKGAFGMNETKWSKMKMSESTGKPFADELTTLLGNPGEDTVTQSVTVLGYKWRDDIDTGLLFKYNTTKTYDNNSHMSILFGRYRWGKQSLLAGPGFHKDRNGKGHATVLAVWNWVGEKGLLLF